MRSISMEKDVIMRFRRIKRKDGMEAMVSSSTQHSDNAMTIMHDGESQSWSK